MARIQPLDPPYDHDTGEQLGKMMPPGVDPILLFRTFAKNLPMTAAMGTWGLTNSAAIRVCRFVIVRS